MGVITEVTSYNLGVGIADVTGPASNIGMMGYAMLNQRTHGIHYRLRSRAFIFHDPTTNKRVVYVTNNICMVYQSVKLTVVDKLKEKFGTLYTAENVLLSGEHTHSGPGGYSWYILYDVTTLGFHTDNFNTIVDGIVRAIANAHTNLQSNPGGRVKLSQTGQLWDTNINRSPSAYLADPPSERSQWPANVDKATTVLRLENAAGTPIGMINWFSVHGTSMNNTNTYISGDNKGHASYLFERQMNGWDNPSGHGPFVAGFGQSNEGDVSPNTKGAFCPDGSPCEFVHSTCGGKTEGCRGLGPGGHDVFKSTQIIGQQQFTAAYQLFMNATDVLTGPVDYRFMYVDMENVQVDAKFTVTGKNATTCTAALGDGFAAGTTDGPGEFDFKQGTNSSKVNPFWNTIGHFLGNPSKEMIACQYPKPILLATGLTKLPSPWTPSILPLQLLRIGKLVIIGVPGEFTTMSGRRLRNTVSRAFSEQGQQVVPIIAGLSNAYSQYITTYEEYQYQRYEGASTLFGPHTLEAYQQEFYMMATAMATGKPVPTGPQPENLQSKMFNLQPSIPEDFGSFGKVLKDVHPSYKLGDVVTVQFLGANLNNDFMTEKTFLAVEQQQSNGSWKVLFTDDDWSTKLRWESSGIIVTESKITIEWTIDAIHTPPGTYRIQHFGTSRDWPGGNKPFTGTSSTFTVTSS